MKRIIEIEQRENKRGEFWFVVKAPNGAVLATSETYVSRRNARRAARTLIGLLEPVKVRFTYRVGQPGCRGYMHVSEIVR